MDTFKGNEPPYPEEYNLCSNNRVLQEVEDESFFGWIDKSSLMNIICKLVGEKIRSKNLLLQFFIGEQGE